jgi:hypothetical protein
VQWFKKVPRSDVDPPARTGRLKLGAGSGEIGWDDEHLYAIDRQIRFRHSAVHSITELILLLISPQWVEHPIAKSQAKP